jgi:2-dehydropantoate 2-reductase
VEAGRPLEIDGLLAAVSEIGRRVDVPTPSTDALLGLARVFAAGRGLYRPGAAAPLPREGERAG